MVPFENFSTRPISISPPRRDPGLKIAWRPHHSFETRGGLQRSACPPILENNQPRAIIFENTVAGSLGGYKVNNSTWSAYCWWTAPHIGLPFLSPTGPFSTTPRRALCRFSRPDNMNRRRSQASNRIGPAAPKCRHRKTARARPILFCLAEATMNIGPLRYNINGLRSSTVRCF